MFGTLLNPATVALYGLAFWLFLLLVAPVKIVYDVQFSALFYIFVSYCGLFAGTMVARSFPSRSASGELRAVTPVSMWLIGICGVFGIVLRLYDQILGRGISFDSSFIESRQALLQNEAGVVSIVSALLYPLCYFPLLFLLIKARSQQVSRTQIFIAIVVFSLPSLLTLIVYSRSQMLIALTMSYFLVALIFVEGRLFSKKLVIPLLAIALILFTVSSSVFDARLNQMGVSVVDSIRWSGYGHTVTPSEWADQILRSNGVFRSLLEQALPMIQYYLHGVFEFALLWSNADHQVVSFGGQHFAPILKAFGIIGLDFGPPTPQEIYPRPGVFSSFFGPLWTDFLWFGPAFMFVIGVCVQFLSRKVRRGDSSFIPLYLYLCVVIFFLPVVNFIVSAQGFYLIFTFLIVGLLFRKRPIKNQSLSLR